MSYCTIYNIFLLFFLLFVYTQIGKYELYELGRYLRSRYNGFLNTTYTSEDVYVFSSDRDRTLMSAACCLAGLYPPQGEQVWNPEINWQPIPIHTVPRNLDKVSKGGFVTVISVEVEIF